MPAVNGSTGLGLAGVTPVASAGRQWRCVVPGDERELGRLRRWLAALLPECSARDDVISVATELGANAIRHTASGRGGSFTVEITWYHSALRVAVSDHGAPKPPRLINDPMGEYGRGLLLVRGLSVRTGVCGDESGRQVWADVAWDGSSGAPPAVAPEQRQAAAW
jgi:anti-sigma regulatory factor (Ser/Thr protein kinase)